MAEVRRGEEIHVSENEYALPICYLSESDITELSLTQYDPFTAQTEMLNTALGKDYKYYTRIHDVDLKTENVTQGSTTDQHHSFKVITQGSSASLTYNFKVPETGKLYMYLPSTYERRVDVTVNGSSKGRYFEGDDNNMKLLGEFTEGAEVTVVLNLTKNDLYFREAEFAVVNEDAVKYALNELKEINKETICTKPASTTVKTEVNCGEDKVLLTTIPVEKGWKIYVDGKETEYLEAVESLIAVPLTAGRHTVEMKFTTAGYPAAMIISAAGIIIFAGLIIYWLKKNGEDRGERKAHLKYIYSGEAEKELLERKAKDIEERNKFREEAEKDGEESEEENEENGDEEGKEEWQGDYDNEEEYEVEVEAEDEN